MPMRSALSLAVLALSMGTGAATAVETTNRAFAGSPPPHDVTHAGAGPEALGPAQQGPMPHGVAVPGSLTQPPADERLYDGLDACREHDAPMLSCRPRVA